MSLTPDATPVVFINAFPLDRQQWEPLIAVLGERLRGDVITFDVPGIGDMPLTDGDPSLELIADAAVVAMREATGSDKAIWIGSSMGGYIALAVSERWPDAVAGLGLLGTKASADGPEALAGREEAAQAALNAGAHPDPEGAARDVVALQGPERDELVEWVALNMRRQHGEGIAWGQRAMAARPDRTEVLRLVDAPVVVVAGGLDTTATVADAEVMADAAGVSPVVLDGVGHLVAVEAPRQVADAIAPLLKN